jgi:hypothetical protein
MANPSKKQKVDDQVQVIQDENIKSAVTAMTVLTDTTIFSGHRDGTICRWDVEERTDRREPTWIICSCTNLTEHEIYGNYEKLGVAGLVVRQSKVANNISDLTVKKDAFLLYSWNHQREDMRESNGIPQKVMIWNCDSGERCAALMVDVGRCDSGAFANPLVSCLVFCKLLVDLPSPNLQSPLEDETPSESAIPTVEKTWIDAIIVGLEATCSAPTANIAVISDAAADMEGQRHSSKTRSMSSAGNILPFEEITRQRMKPWSAVGGFIRALVVVGTYVVSVTETARNNVSETRDTLRGKSEESLGESKHEEIKSTNDQSGGQLHEITVWDTACPGTALHVLNMQNAVGKNLTDSFRGSVYSVSLSSNKIFLAMSSSNASGKIVVLDFDPKVSDGSCLLSIFGVVELVPGSASSQVGDWLGVSRKSSCSDVNLYSFSNLIKALENNTTDYVIDTQQLEQLRVPAPRIKSSCWEPSSILVSERHVIAGFSNGAILRKNVVAAMKRSGGSSIVSNEYVSCSTAPIGLRGSICPHLSPDANNVALQNKCIIV